MVLAQAELLLGNDHPFAGDPPHRLRLQDETLPGVSVDELGAGLGERHDGPDPQVLRTRDDGHLAPLTVVDGREPELVGVRVLVEPLDARDPDLVPPRTLDLVDLGAGHVQQARELVDARPDVDVLAEPLDRHMDEH